LSFEVNIQKTDQGKTANAIMQGILPNLARWGYLLFGYINEEEGLHYISFTIIFSANLVGGNTRKIWGCSLSALPGLF